MKGKIIFFIILIVILILLSINYGFTRDTKKEVANILNNSPNLEGILEEGDWKWLKLEVTNIEYNINQS